MNKDNSETTEIRQVYTGWASLWKWIGTIIVVLILAGVIIYVANTFLLGEQIRADANASSEGDEGTSLSVTIEGGDDAATDDAATETTQ